MTAKQINLNCLVTTYMDDTILIRKDSDFHEKCGGPVFHWTSHVVLVVKNLPANAGDLRDTGSTPG